MPVGIRLLAGLPGTTGDLSRVQWCGASKVAEPYGQCGHLVALEFRDAGGVAQVGRAELMVEVAHRDSVWRVT